MDLLSGLEQEGLSLTHLSKLVMLAFIYGRLSHDSLSALSLLILIWRDIVFRFHRFLRSWALGYGSFFGWSLARLNYRSCFR